MGKKLTDVNHLEAKIGLITISDTRREETDRSGPVMREELQKLGYLNLESMIVTDDESEIINAIRRLAETCTVIITSGGTGFTSRDVTPEATLKVIDRQADSISHYIRAKGLETAPLSPLSRGIAGILGRTFILNLPGSPKAAKEGIDALSVVLPGIITQLLGDYCEVHFETSSN